MKKEKSRRWQKNKGKRITATYTFYKKLQQIAEILEIEIDKATGKKKPTRKKQVKEKVT